MKIWRLYAFFIEKSGYKTAATLLNVWNKNVQQHWKIHLYQQHNWSTTSLFQSKQLQNCTWLSSRMDINLVFFVIIWTKQLLDLIQTVPTTSNSGMQWNYHWGNCQTGIERVIHLSSALSKRKTVLITSKMNNLNPKEISNVWFVGHD